MADLIDRVQWDLLTPDEQYLVLAGFIAREQVCDALLASIPGCPKHGACVNHAIQWVRKAQGFTAIHAETWCCQDEQEGGV